jgi:hypothetical protein
MTSVWVTVSQKLLLVHPCVTYNPLKLRGWQVWLMVRGLSGCMTTVEKVVAYRCKWGTPVLHSLIISAR